MKRTILIIVVATVVLSSIAIVALNLSAEKDYTGLAVADLPLEEQIKVARSVSLSAVVNWGAGGLLYCQEVAEAFLLSCPYPEFLEQVYGKYELFIPGEKYKNSMAFLSQSITDHKRHGALGLSYLPKSFYTRELFLYTKSGVYKIQMLLNKDGVIVDVRHSFQPYN
ncbi:MAG: hypothetical protein Q8N36_02160 [bacterium]|nr:hypothetical protein [bacterium]